MSLKITCSKCKSPHVLREPLPLPGSQVHCSNCGLKMTMTYPVGLLDKLRSKGSFKSIQECCNGFKRMNLKKRQFPL